MPTIEIETDDPIQRHLAALRIMSYMVFPDDPELRKASETTFRTRIADWYSQVFATREKKAQIQFVKDARRSRLTSSKGRSPIRPRSQCSRDIGGVSRRRGRSRIPSSREGPAAQRWLPAAGLSVGEQRSLL